MKYIILIYSIILLFVVSKSVSIRINSNLDLNNDINNYKSNNNDNSNHININSNNNDENKNLESGSSSESNNVFNPDIVGIWPKPKFVNHGNQTFYISPKFYFSSNVITSKILNDTARRYYDMIFTEDNTESDKDINYFSYLKIQVESDDETLKFGFNESYTLHIKETYGILKAGTIYGAMRGLETFYQMIYYNYTSQSYILPHSPWNIFDEPRFPHRGVLLDTSRHWYSPTFIKKFIDSLSYNKFNTFHWHAVDAESFPLTSTTFPNITKGAWTPFEIYSTKDIREIVQHAKERGIRVVLEIDMPGHASSWGSAFSDVIPEGIETAPGCNWDCANAYCNVPLDPSKEKSYDIAFKLLDEFTGNSNSFFQDEFFHIGGDEVEYSCWNNSDSIKEWMNQNNFTSYEQVAMYFELKAISKLTSLNRSPVMWEDAFLLFGEQLPKDVVVHVYHNPLLAVNSTAAGYRTLQSPYWPWYLDNPSVNWERVYQFDPADQIDSSNLQLLLGGETCMWSELVDTSNAFAKIYPRASATAEVLWSSSIDDINIAHARLERFRCSLLLRDIGAAPLNSTSPLNPKSCYYS